MNKGTMKEKLAALEKTDPDAFRELVESYLENGSAYLSSDLELVEIPHRKRKGRFTSRTPDVAAELWAYVEFLCYRDGKGAKPTAARLANFPGLPTFNLFDTPDHRWRAHNLVFEGQDRSKGIIGTLIKIERESRPARVEYSPRDLSKPTEHGGSIHKMYKDFKALKGYCEGRRRFYAKNIEMGLSVSDCDEKDRAYKKPEKNLFFAYWEKLGLSDAEIDSKASSIYDYGHRVLRMLKSGYEGETLPAYDREWQAKYLPPESGNL